jgi:hypothetical protein
MKQLRILAILLAALMVTSCNKDEEGTGTGDALIVVKKSGSATVYGLSLYAYTFSTFSSVSAVSSVNPEKTYTLKSNLSNFAYETPDNAFTAVKPVAATYTFSATFENGVQQNFQNTLLDAVLPVPSFEKCEYNGTTHQLELNWPLINGATSYAVNIFDLNQLVFATNELKDLSTGAYAIKANGGGWKAGFTPVSGKTYTVRLFAYMFEPNGGSYNIQCVSMADKSIVWGN